MTTAKSVGCHAKPHSLDDEICNKMTPRNTSQRGQSSKRSRACNYPGATFSRVFPISALLCFPCLVDGQVNCNGNRQPVTGGTRGGASGRLCTGRIPLTLARSIDGSEDHRAQTGAALLRLTTPSYPDGVGDRMQEFPNARGISNIVANSNNEGRQRLLNDDEGVISPSDM